MTHGAYIEEFEDFMADYGVWNEEASNHFAVNEDAPFDSNLRVGKHDVLQDGN